MPFRKLSITVEEALAEARAEHSGWRMLPELDNRLEAQDSGMDAARLRQLQDEVARLPFPEDPGRHAAWYREIHARLDALGAFIGAYRSCDWFDNSLLFDAGGNPETAKPFPVSLKTLYVIADDFPSEALPFLRQCALRVCERDRWNGKEEGIWGGLVLGMYAVLAGADAVDDLLDEWRKLPPVASLANSYPYPCLHRHIALLLVLIAPPSRYPELAGILRAQFDAIGVQKRGPYGEDTPGQGTLGAIAYALAIFSPWSSASAIGARSSEYGLSWRDARWGLAGITPAKFADMLVYAGAIGPVRPVELQRALCSIFGNYYSSWMRELCRGQDRLMEMDIDSTNKVHTRDQTYWDNDYLPAVAVLPARMARPQIHLTHVHTHDRGLETIRFVHAENVFEFTLTDMDLDPREAGAYFNQFLEYIGHPQRIFNIYDGGSCLDKEAAAFICADKARFPEILRQLNHGDDLDILVEMLLFWQTGVSA